RERLQPVAHLGERRRGMHHRLLVARHDEAQAIARGEERFAEPGDVAVAEDAEHAGEHRLRPAVARAALRDQEFHERLTDGQAAGSHVHPPCEATNASTSGHVGMKLAQPCRVTMIAPVALPTRAARASVQPRRSPYKSPAANASPAPSTFRTSMRNGATSTGAWPRSYTRAPSAPRFRTNASGPPASSRSAPAAA